MNRFVNKYYFRRKRKILHGLMRKWTRKRIVPYHWASWWDDVLYTQGVSDIKTIDPRKNDLSVRHHYLSIEMLILRYLYHARFDITGKRILDIGSGAGHWVDFFKSLGAGSVVGSDVSKNCIDYLNQKYAADRTISFQFGSFQDFLKNNHEKFDVINAIGVMFHVVDPTEWLEGIDLCSKRLNEDGLFIVSGYFGLFNNIDVQVDRNGKSNKRLRSKSCWKKVLRQHGFSNIAFLKNNHSFDIRDTQPENNLLAAGK